MYNSPIELFHGDMNVELEGTILKAVANVGVNVNKEELLKALNYDRKQYKKGYQDAMNEVKQPRPLKYEEIKASMYIWDNELKQCAKVETTFIQLERDKHPFSLLSTRWINFENGFLGNVAFEENRFYPITIPNVRGTE
ncbi:hypothetical protein DWX89_09140 [Coprobacillus sp. AF21-8LB]|nr:hypothetical protein DWX89_09140 [Coprobacillus sp. AF21-8LB]